MVFNQVIATGTTAVFMRTPFSLTETALDNVNRQKAHLTGQIRHHISFKIRHFSVAYPGS
jgi:hypothetical protein